MGGLSGLQTTRLILVAGMFVVGWKGGGSEQGLLGLAAAKSQDRGRGRQLAHFL